ncbi:hypothetical protein C8F04DRAFT_960378, partial [Mycena alexandri]
MCRKEGTAPPPADARFVGATIQRSGSILLHMNTADAAKWIKANVGNFLAEMGGTSVYKQRLYNVKVQYVPVSFDPESQGARRLVDDDNNFPRGALAKGRWLKPPQQRHSQQRVAHAVLGFEEATVANRVIRDGVFIEGARVFGNKLLTEPIRCMKCQAIGQNHIASTCPAEEDVCARCGEAHRTIRCKAPDNERACANCKAAKRLHLGHGAADRACPIFEEKLQYALERNPEAKYPYFLVADDPSTW